MKEKHQDLSGVMQTFHPGMEQTAAVPVTLIRIAHPWSLTHSGCALLYSEPVTMQLIPIQVTNSLQCFHFISHVLQEQTTVSFLQ